MCTIPFENWRGFLTLMIQMERKLELMKKYIYNSFEHIWFKNVFDMKIMDFENVALTKKMFIYM